ncbi:MAG: Glu-tRNA(Gln) amidotransferase subunit GatE [Nanoarchaeota archaeon]|nr:Glu-tRNA(Gln) amidotransferase subunit GatE [Nanoarchaeota archaeon]MBU1988959.1 Glu-tRNA(Gln) amidotransferase subunit GatE [Nanoarchaeota archaeon]
MDYVKIGLKAGLEIHQQLDPNTGKLFCNCPSYLRKDKPDFEVKRKLHKVAGETGEIDIAALYESDLNKEFTYQCYNDTTCLVELDESPPHEINPEALDIALQISLLLNCEIVLISQIMRKTVIDGSNTSGFQRTVLIAKDGFIELPSGKVGIWYVYLEEDAARSVSKEKNKATYRLDRLGIPLVEIVTAPDITTPEQAKEVALHIGEILRACKVKRGIGTIRQDINVSIKKHPRAEIKGFQDPKIFVKVVEKEIERQQANLKAKEKKDLKQEVRGANPDATTKFLRPLPGHSRMYPETDLPLLKISRERINKVKKSLPKLKSDIRDELKKKGLTNELINLVLDNNLDEFEILIKVQEKDANLVAKMITLWRKELATKQKVSLEKIKDLLPESSLEKILEAINEKKISKEDAKPVMEALTKGKPFQDAIKIEKVSDDEVEEEITKIVKSKPGLSPNAYMGLVMAKFKGKLDAKKAMQIIGKLVN